MLDFGIAKGRLSDVETQAGVFKGKLAFIPPEQVQCGELDRRTDLFAAGAMLWRTLTGAPLWHRTRPTEIFRALASGEIPDLLAICPDAPPELRQICLRALAPRKEDRYPSALEMKRELEAFMAARGLVGSQAELGEIVSRLFAPDRAALQQKTQDRLRELCDETPASSAGRGAFAGERPATLRPAVLSAPPPPTTSGVSQRWPARLWASGLPGAATGVALAVMALLVGIALLGRARVERASSGSAKPGAESVAVDIAASPADARIRVDGVPRPNPWVTRLPRGAGTLLVTAEREGFLGKTRRVELKADVVVDLDLASDGHALAVAPVPVPAPAPVARVPRATAMPTLAAEAEPVPQAPPSASDAEPPEAPPCAQPWRVSSTGVKRLRPECLAEVVTEGEPASCAYPWQVDQRGVKRLRAECARSLE